MSPQSLGAWGEAVAADRLASAGYEILAKNWHSADGEIDLIAEVGGTIVFVEVKARSSRAFGSPEAAITKEKQRRIQRAAWRYLQAAGRLDSDWRIDVVAIERGEDGEVGRLEHYVNAVEAAEDLRRS